MGATESWADIQAGWPPARRTAQDLAAAGQHLRAAMREQLGPAIVEATAVLTAMGDAMGERLARTPVHVGHGVWLMLDADGQPLLAVDPGLIRDADSTTA